MFLFNCGNGSSIAFRLVYLLHSDLTDQFPKELCIAELGRPSPGSYLSESSKKKTFIIFTVVFLPQFFCCETSHLTPSIPTLDS